MIIRKLSLIAVTKQLDKSILMAATLQGIEPQDSRMRRSTKNKFHVSVTIHAVVAENDNMAGFKLGLTT